MRLVGGSAAGAPEIARSREEVSRALGGRGRKRLAETEAGCGGGGLTGVVLGGRVVDLVLVVVREGLWVWGGGHGRCVSERGWSRRAEGGEGGLGEAGRTKGKEARKSEGGGG